MLDTRLEIISPIAVSLYFDNFYSTQDPIPILHAFLPYQFTPKKQDTFQDAGYYAELEEFCPNPYEERPPIPIHTHSYHSSKKMICKSYLSSVHRISRICSDPNIAVFTCLSRFLANLRRFGRDPTQIALICFFPDTTPKS